MFLTMLSVSMYELNSNLYLFFIICGVQLLCTHYLVNILVGGMTESYHSYIILKIIYKDKTVRYHFLLRFSTDNLLCFLFVLL